MTDFRQQLTLRLRYDVRFTRDLFAPVNPCLSDVLAPAVGGPGKVLACLDAGLAAANPGLPDRIRAYFAARPQLPALVDVQVVPGGEAIKNDASQVDRLGRLFLEHGMCRHSYVMAIGGGAVLDAVGYAAAITHRGLRLIRLPSTVLSQNDSGVGVKTGVNRFGIKNYYGVFGTPAAVLCDLDLLDTLDDRTWHSGISEAFKVGIIKDAAFLERLVADAPALAARQEPAGSHMVTEAARLHLEHIGRSGDPFETGTSRPLDFGHWSAHKLESLSDFALLHGEAVAIGIALDLHYAARLGFIETEDAQRICLAMQRIGLPIWHPLLSERPDDVLRGLDEFREHLGGELTLAMPQPLGSQTDIHTVDMARMQQALADLQTLATAGQPQAPAAKRTKHATSTR